MRCGKKFLEYILFLNFFEKTFQIFFANFFLNFFKFFIFLRKVSL